MQPTNPQRHQPFNELFELLEQKIFSLKHTWIVVFLLVAGIVLLVTPFFFFSHVNKTPVTGSLATVVTPTSDSTWKPFTSRTFTLEYPSDWQSSVATESAVQTEVLFGPGISEQTGKPGVTIDSRVATSEAIINDAESKLITTYGFTKGIKKIKTLSIPAIVGVMPFSIIKGKLVDTPHFEEVLDTYQQKRWYRIMFSYNGVEKDSVTEEKFNHMLETFRVSQEK